MPKKYDFAGYATRHDIQCTDGRVIRKTAFANQNGARVPLVWMHQRNDPKNVIGHADLEYRDDGIYCYATFNDSEKAEDTRRIVKHGDVTSLSIFANNLVQKGNSVTHGIIREVSVVIAGANSGAVIDQPFIDNPVVQHSDGSEYEDFEQATIFSWVPLDDLEHSNDEEEENDVNKNDEIDETVEHSDDSEETIQNVYDSMTDKQKKVVDYLLRSALNHASEEDDDDEEIDDEEDEDDDMEHADKDRTVQDVYDEMTDEQKKVVAYIVGAALAEQEEDEEDAAEHSDMEEDIVMKKNVFDQDQELELEHTATTKTSLTREEVNAIFKDAQKSGSLKESFLEHAASYGIENIDILFPDAKAIANEPYMIKRDTEWVAGVLSETRHVPFSRIKSVCADITADEARARGYVKGNLKKDEVIKLLKRVTTPTTIYKKQKLDRDDLIDITELNVVAWLKAEMRVMLNEELGRAILVGDGRESDDEDKINEDNIRPIWKDDDMYAHHVVIPAAASTEEVVEMIIRARKNYKGSGSPSMYTTADMLVDMLLIKDKIGRRLYNSESEVASNLRVSKIVEVPVMEDLTREVDGKTYRLLGIMVNLRDYTVGATQGGQVSMFDDFDIDYNQYKYLLETRCCGALVMPKSAIVIEQEVAAEDEDEEDAG